MRTYEFVRAQGANPQGFLRANYSLHVDTANALAEAQRQELVARYEAVEGNESKDSVQFVVEPMRNLDTRDRNRLALILGGFGVEMKGDVP